MSVPTGRGASGAGTTGATLEERAQTKRALPPLSSEKPGTHSQELTLLSIRSHRPTANRAKPMTAAISPIFRMQ